MFNLSTLVKTPISNKMKSKKFKFPSNLANESGDEDIPDEFSPADRR